MERWLGFISGSLIAQVFDPLFWIALAIGAGLGKTRSGMALGLILVLTLAGGGWYMILSDHSYSGNPTALPLRYAVMYVVGKLLGFALGLAFNRVMQRIEKRSTRVLEKART